MASLPIDVSNPTVQEFLSLVWRVLTPLSVNIATVPVRSTIGAAHFFTLIPPPTRMTSRCCQSLPHVDPTTPRMALRLFYLFQIGYCPLLIFAKSSDTKKTFVKAIGFSLVLANWAIAWVSPPFAFLFSTFLLGIPLLLLIYSNIALLVYHAMMYSCPFGMTHPL
ncbi:hypothetical protein OG21DRAFT_1421085 [Imleria badia]|nr:hypothetical protein OG21DRAFT_1421085 [Imleria badia]